MGGVEAFFESVEKEAEGLQEWKGELVRSRHNLTNPSATVYLCSGLARLTITLSFQQISFDSTLSCIEEPTLRRLRLSVIIESSSFCCGT